MPEVHSRTQPARSKSSKKPAKPYPAFPLFPHANGCWAKKVKGKVYYFGAWIDPDTALKKFLSEKDFLYGVKERAKDNCVTLADLNLSFIKAKERLVASGELMSRSYEDYRKAGLLLLEQFGPNKRVVDLTPDDFGAFRSKMSENWGPVTLGNAIQRIRVIFKYGWDTGLIERPMRYGQGFKRPSRKVLRIQRAKQGLKLFSADEIQRLLATASPPMRAMILLAMNGGFGNADCGQLPLSAVDLNAALIDFPRPKTGIIRRVPLWPETVAALREVIAKHKTPKDKADADLLFITVRGSRWHKEKMDNPISKEMRKLLDGLGISGHRNFYALRHCFETVADKARDQPAVDHLMGHLSQHMSAVYRESISEARLRAVVDYVRNWLFTPTAVAPVPAVAVPIAESAA